MRLVRCSSCTTSTTGERGLVHGFICLSVCLTGPSRFTNLAALSTLATTFLEKEYDFWAANLFATISLVVSIVVLVVWAGKLGEMLQRTTRYLRCLWAGRVG